MLFSGRVLYWGTPALQFVPWRSLALQVMRGGEFPFWNPFNGMGAPLMANYQSALFYPPGWILYLFGLVRGAEGIAWGYTLLVPLHLAWAGIGMARLMERLRFSELPRIVSSLSFSMCGYLVARAGFFSIIWAASWMPWVLWAVNGLILSEGLYPRRQYKEIIQLSIVTAMMLLAGHAQVSWYILMFATVWCVVNGWIDRRADFGKLLGQYVLSMGLGCMLACIQLVPTAEYLIMSQRANSVPLEKALSYSFWPWRLITFIAPDFFGNPIRGNYWGYASYWEDAGYIGILPLVFAVGTIPACFSRRNHYVCSLTRLIRLLWVFTLLGVILAMGRFTPVFIFLYEKVPSFNMFNAPARFLIWTEFSLCILAGFGLQKMRPATGKKLYFLRLGTTGGFAISLGGFLTWKLLGRVEPTFIFPTVLAGIWLLVTGVLILLFRSSSSGTAPIGWASLVTVVVFVDLFVAHIHLNPSTKINFFQMQEDQSDVFMLENEPSRFFIPGNDEYHLKFDRFFRLQDYRQKEDIEDLRSINLPNINILNGAEAVNNFDPILPSRFDRVVEYISALDTDLMLPWLKWMNVNEVLRSGQDVFEEIRVTRINGQQSMYWIDCANIPENEEAAWDQLVKQMADSKRNSDSPRMGTIEKVKVENEKCNGLKANPQIQLLKRNGNRIEVMVTTQQEGWLVFADMWYPGWQAKVDNSPATIGIADYLFRGLFVGAGRHLISMVFRPVSAIVGAGITFLAVIILGVLVHILRQAPMESAMNK